MRSAPPHRTGIAGEQVVWSIDITHISTVSSESNFRNSSGRIVKKCLLRAGKILDGVWLRSLFTRDGAKVEVISEVGGIAVRVSDGF